MRFVDTNVLLYAVSRDPTEAAKAARATAMMLAALATRERFQISNWDAAILEAGRSVGCDIVLSEDLSDGQDYDGMRVENPFRA